jgi:hypothetical protein
MTAASHAQLRPIGVIRSDLRRLEDVVDLKPVR